MRLKNIDKYRAAFEKYNGTGYNADDHLLLKDAERFYNSKESAEVVKIIQYIRDNKKSKKLIDLADELEKLLASEPIVAEPVPASNSSVVIAPPDKISAPAKAKYAFPPGYFEVKAVDEALPVIEAGEESTKPTATSVAPMPVLTSPPVIDRTPDAIFYIQTGDSVKEHELATMFPMASESEFEAIKESIKIEQKIPVMMHKGVLIDGRTRLAACRSLGIPAKAIEWNGVGTIEELVLALNLNHRNISPSQRAAFGVRLLPSLEQEAEKRKKAGTGDDSEKIHKGRAVDIAGKKVGVNGRYIDDAKKIAGTSPDLYIKLMSGAVTIAQANKQIRAAEKDPALPERKRFSVTDAVSKLLELIPKEMNDSLKRIAAESPAAVSKTILAHLKETSVVKEESADAAG